MKKILFLFITICFCTIGYCQSDKYTFNKKIVQNEYNECKTIQTPTAIYITDSLITIKEKGKSVQYLASNLSHSDYNVIEENDIYCTHIYHRKIIYINKNGTISRKFLSESYKGYKYEVLLETSMSKRNYSETSTSKRNYFSNIEFIILKTNREGNIIETILYQNN